MAIIEWRSNAKQGGIQYTTLEAGLGFYLSLRVMPMEAEILSRYDGTAHSKTVYIHSTAPFIVETSYRGTSWGTVWGQWGSGVIVRRRILTMGYLPYSYAIPALLKTLRKLTRADHGDIARYGLVFARSELYALLKHGFSVFQ